MSSSLPSYQRLPTRPHESTSSYSVFSKDGESLDIDRDLEAVRGKTMQYPPPPGCYDDGSDGAQYITIPPLYASYIFSPALGSDQTAVARRARSKEEATDQLHAVFPKLQTRASDKIHFHVLVEATSFGSRSPNSSSSLESTKRTEWVLIVGPEAWEDLVVGQAPARIKVTVVLTWMEWLWDFIIIASPILSVFLFGTFIWLMIMAAQK